MLADVLRKFRKLFSRKHLRMSYFSVKLLEPALGPTSVCRSLRPSFTSFSQKVLISFISYSAQYYGAIYEQS